MAGGPRDDPTREAVEGELDRLRDGVTVALAWFVLLVALPLVLALGLPNPDPRLLASGLLLCAAAGGATWLVRRKRGRHARLVLASVVAGVFMTRTWLLGGVSSVPFLGWPLLIMLSALFFGRRGVWAALGLGLTWGLVLWGAAEGGVLPAPVLDEGLARRLALAMLLFTAVAVLMDVVMVSMAGAFRRLAHSEGAHEALAERYVRAAEGARYGVWEYDLDADTLWLGAGVGELLGEAREPSTASAEVFRARIHEGDRAAAMGALERHIAGLSAVYTAEYRLRRGEGPWVWVRSRGQLTAGDDGGRGRIVGFIEDITERKAMVRELQKRAFHDPLTGLANRDLFLDRLSQTLAESRRRKVADFAVVFIDLDRFKVINDSLGHAAGDLLLTQLADRLGATVREPDTVARLGGDEFTLLLKAVDSEAAARAAVSRVQIELDRAFRLNDQEVFVGASIGILMGTLDYDDPLDLLRDADLAMYSVKGDTNEAVGIFEPSMRRRMKALMHLDSALRRALEQGEIVPWFQPIVNLLNGEVLGFEALARWIHPDGSVQGPEHFIRRAEETGQIAELDRRIIKRASAVVGAWNASGATLRLSVNLSARQFHSRGLPAYIEHILATSGLRPDDLQLEITEGILLGDVPGVRGTLAALGELGVRIAFDDFGTGYSSLSYLHRFEIEVLKIDRSFVQERGELGPGPICRAIHSMASSLGIETVAEGIENEAQRQALLELGCRYGQGHLFGAALPAEEAWPPRVSATRSDRPA